MSNIHKEYETRLMISEEKYFTIVTYFMNVHPNQQFLQNTNTYYDTDDLFLRIQHMTLRLRNINDVKSEFTLKIKGSKGDEEITDSLTPKEVDLLFNENLFPYGQVRNRLMLLPYTLDKYHKITSLFNRRLEVPFEGYLLVIDKNVYGEVTDYDIEIESEKSINHAKEVLKQYIDKFELSVSKEKYVGKARRAIDEAMKER